MAEIKDVIGQNIDVGDFIVFPRGRYSKMTVAKVMTIEKFRKLEMKWHPSYQDANGKITELAVDSVRMLVRYEAHGYKRNVYLRRLNRLVKLDASLLDENFKNKYL
jgi:hypothetical protein